MTKTAIAALVWAILALFATVPTAHATTYFRQTTNSVNVFFAQPPVTVLSLNVRAGNWVIETKAVTSGSYFSLTCSLLVNGAVVDQTTSGLAYQAYSAGQTIIDLAAVTVSSKSTIELSCNLDAGTVATVNASSDLLVRPAEKFK